MPALSPTLPNLRHVETYLPTSLDVEIFLAQGLLTRTLLVLYIDTKLPSILVTFRPSLALISVTNYPFAKGPAL